MAVHPCAGPLSAVRRCAVELKLDTSLFCRPIIRFFVLLQTVRAWDMRSRNRSPIQTLEGCKDSATSVSSTPSGDELVVGCVDGRVRTYDLRAAKVHEDNVHAPVTHASLSHDGKCLLVTCLGGVVRLLEKESGSQLNSYTG